MDKEYLQGRKDLTEPEYAPIDIIVNDINYDISDEDCVDNGMTKREILKQLPKELEFTIVPESDDFDLVEAITEMITEITGWCVIDYNYKLV